MPLKFKFKSREEIPAEHQALYVERDGAVVLDAEGRDQPGYVAAQFPAGRNFAARSDE